MQAGAGTSLQRAAHLSVSDWRLLLRAAGELLLARVRHAILSPAAILEVLAIEGARGVVRQRPTKDTPARVAWAIGVAAARVPWRADCLIRAMAAACWLRRHGYAAEVFLGVTRERGAFGAHAWVRCGDIVVTGGDGRGFTPILSPPPT